MCSYTPIPAARLLARQCNSRLYLVIMANPMNGLLIWQALQLLVVGFVAFLVIRLLWRMNYPKK